VNSLLEQEIRKPVSHCRLCQQQKPLRDSHVFPDFVGRWLKRTSATGKLRSAKSPNLRQQDTRTIRLLCQDCEQLFGIYEKYFAETIFIPVLESFTPTVDYDERLLKFIVSLSWRVFVTAQDHGWQSLEVKQEATRTADNWRRFLRAEEALRSGDHHLLMLRLVKDAPMIEGSTVDLNFYFFRTVDATIARNRIGEAAVTLSFPDLQCYPT
jgi:hypothetical protein